MAIMLRPFPIFIVVCLVLSGALHGQSGDGVVSHYRRLTLSFNPLGLVEFGPVVGLGAGYQWNQNLQVWVEGSRIFPGWNWNDYPITSGSRVELALKYYYGRRNEWFMGGEVRWKQVYYDERSDFISRLNNNLARSARYTLRNDLPGVAFLTGQRTRTFWRNRFWVEWSIGLGLKYRFVRIEGGPQGYQLVTDGDYRERPTDIALDVQRFRVYIPGAIRVVYAL